MCPSQVKILAIALRVAAIILILIWKLRHGEVEDPVHVAAGRPWV